MSLIQLRMFDYYQDTGEVTDVHTTEVTTMVRGKLRMRLLPLDQTLTLTLMAGVSYFIQLINN